MEAQIKHIVSQYIKVPAEQINPQTIIDRSAVASSIILHRMYAQLANEGIHVDDQSAIKTFGQLIAGINGNNIPALQADLPVSAASPLTAALNGPSIGIDTESIAAMPLASDFREEAFYSMNFGASEIAYCILQPSPYASFAGLFAAKEAIIKADNSFKSRPFNSIIIDHLPGGKPVFPGFQVSISHTGDTAVAVAIQNPPAPASPLSAPATGAGNSPIITILAVAAFILSLLALILFLLKNR